ncbi:hypothetical protein C1H46_041082 [Malus baccata]|uniref:Uncharacterized protein n=1 Tax=Malus baccata TaxID=106549 RepID=A0A540KGN6_MALBA|nr:hypothetical protein C1H46_041082 [Malus baccata]
MEPQRISNFGSLNGTERRAKEHINSSKKQNMNQVLNLRRLNKIKQSTSTKFRADQRSKKWNNEPRCETNFEARNPQVNGLTVHY